MKRPKLQPILVLCVACISFEASGQVAVVTVAQLKSRPPSGAMVEVSGFRNDADGGQGRFRWSAACPGAADDGLYVASAIAKGCWVRQWAGAINLAWYGVTERTDISGPLLAAIAALDSGGKIVVPRGFYYSRREIATGAKAVEIDFQSGTLQAQANIKGSMFYSDTAGGKWTLRNLILDGNWARVRITAYGINIGNRSQGPALHGVTIKNMPSTGVSLHGTGTTIVRDSYANDNGGIGWTGASDGVMDFVNSGALRNGDYGGFIAGRNGTSVIGGNWSRNKSGGLAFYWGQNGASYAVGGKITGVTADSNGEMGLTVGQGVRGVAVSGNIVTDNTVAGISIDTLLNDGRAAPASVSVTNNHIRGGTMSLRWNGAIGGEISGNTLTDPQANGAIYVRAGSSGVRIHGNRMIGSRAFVQIAGDSSATVAPDNAFSGLSPSLPPILYLRRNGR